MKLKKNKTQKGFNRKKNLGLVVIDLNGISVNLIILLKKPINNKKSMTNKKTNTRQYYEKKTL
jgi:hypothetical protein